MLKKIYLTDSLQLQNIVKPVGEQEVIIYIMSPITGALVHKLLNAVAWDSHIQTPEIATVVSTISRKNVSSQKKVLPMLKQDEGYLFITPKPELDLEAPLEVDWRLIVLACVLPSNNEDDVDDEESILDCSSCESVTRCFKSDIDA